MNLIIHAGLPKTGTTSIQNSLADNKSLLENNNYYYPILDVREKSHHLLTFSFRDNILTEEELHYVVSQANMFYENKLYDK